MMQGPEDDLADFLAIDQEESVKPPPAPSMIVKDLVASPARLAVVYVLGAALGYLLSLAICAQCSIGLSPVAWKTATLLDGMPDPLCPLTCGFVFGISPTLVSLLLLSRFQHRYLLFRLPWIPILIPILASAFLVFRNVDHSWAWHRIWLLAAIATPYVIEGIAAILLRQERSKAV